MAVIYNLIGTSYSSFQVGKKGPTIYQGTTSPAGGSAGDFYIQNGSVGNQAIYQNINGVWTALASTNSPTLVTPNIGSATASSITSNAYFLSTTISSASGNGFFLYAANDIGISIGGSHIGDFTSTGLNGIAIGASTPSTGAFSSLSVTTAIPVSSGGTGLSSTSQNYVFIGPTSGSGSPTWRALVSGDIPSLSSIYLPLSGGALTGGLSGTSAAFSSLSLTTALPISSGGTGVTATNQNYVFAGPSSGGSGAPSWRQLVVGDLPSFSSTYLSTSGGTVTGTITLNGGGTSIDFTNSTSNWINFETYGIAPPAFSTRSVGTKIVLYNTINSTALDYAFGMDASTLWSTVSTSICQWVWKAPNAAGSSIVTAMTLSGTGNLTVLGQMSAASYYVGSTPFSSVYVPQTSVGSSNGVAGLNSSGQVPLSQLPVVAVDGGGTGRMLFDLTVGVPAASSLGQINITGTGTLVENYGVSLSLRDSSPATSAPATGTYNSLRGLTQSVPSTTPYRIACYVLIDGNGQYSNAYWGFQDTAGKYEFCDIVQSNSGTSFSEHMTWSSSTYRSGLSTISNIGVPILSAGVWLGIRDDGAGNVYWEISSSGATWQAIFEVTKSSGYLSNYSTFFIGSNFIDVSNSTTQPQALNILAWDVNALNRLVGYGGGNNTITIGQIGSTTFTYSGGNLTQVTYPDGSYKSLSYTSGSLTGISYYSSTSTGNGLAAQKTFNYSSGSLSSITTVLN